MIDQSECFLGWGHCREQAGWSPGPSGNFSHTDSSAAEGRKEMERRTVQRYRGHSEGGVGGGGRGRDFRKCSPLSSTKFDLWIHTSKQTNKQKTFKQTGTHIGNSVSVTARGAGFEVRRLAGSVFTPPPNLSSFICLTITNLLCTRSIHFFAPAPPPPTPPLYPLLSQLSFLLFCTGPQKPILLF